MREASDSEKSGVPSKETFLNKDKIREEATTNVNDGNYKEAAQKFDTVASFFKEDLWFLHGQGLSLVRVGGEDNVKRGISVLEHAEEMNTNGGEPTPWITLALAEAYSRNGKYDQSREKYEVLKQRDPENPEVAFLQGDADTIRARANTLQEKARAARDSGDKYAALKDFEKAIILAGEDVVPWAVHDRALMFMEDGHPREAIPELHKATILIPESAWPHLSLALACERIGDDRLKALAQNEYMEVLALDPNNQAAKDGLQRLRSEVPPQTELPPQTPQSRPPEARPPGQPEISKRQEHSPVEELQQSTTGAIDKVRGHLRKLTGRDK